MASYGQKYPDRCIDVITDNKSIEKNIEVNVPALKSIAGDEMIPARFLARHL